MPTIVRIKFGSPAYVETPQCSAPVDPAGAYKGYRQERIRIAGRKGYKGNQCQRSSSYVIDDKPYCITHAGQIALRILECK